MATTRSTSPTRHPHFLAVFIAAVVVVIGVILFGIIVARGTSFTSGETGLLAQIAGWRVPPLVDASLALDLLFGPRFAIAIVLIVAAIIFFVSRRWGTVIHFVLLVAGTWLGSAVVKLIVHRPRPIASLGDRLVPNPDQNSYPSGHVCFAVGLGFAVFVLVARSRVRVLVAVLAILLSVVTAASRVYLGVHFPTDALASLVYAAAAFVGIEALWRRFSGRLGLDRPRGGRARGDRARGGRTRGGRAHQVG